MKKIILGLLGAAMLTSCYNRDIEEADAIVSPISNLEYKIDDDTLRVNWTLAKKDGYSVVVSSNAGTEVVEGDPESYKYGIVKVGKEYTFTFKVKDAAGNLSTGNTIHFTREGGLSVTNLVAKQIDGTKDVKLTWSIPQSESFTKIEVRYDGKVEEVSGSATECVIKGLSDKQYQFGVVSFNAEGKSSETSYKDIRIGSTKFAFLGLENDFEAFKAGADDDELAAAYWLFEESGLDAEYLPFSQVASTDLNKYRALWWIHDRVGFGGFPAEVPASAVEAIKQYHINGGGLLLNTHAISLVNEIGRMTAGFNKTIGNGGGFHNNDVWSMNVQIMNHDESTHPIYESLPLAVSTPQQKTIEVIGAGWKEDHNYVFCDVAYYFQIGNGDEAAYQAFIQRLGMRPLAMWSHITDYYMIANFECMPFDGYKGTCIGIGIGGFEWNQNKDSGEGYNPYNGETTHNPHQANIKQITLNALEYLKTK